MRSSTWNTRVIWGSVVPTVVVGFVVVIVGITVVVVGIAVVVVGVVVGIIVVVVGGLVSASVESFVISGVVCCTLLVV